VSNNPLSYVDPNGLQAQAAPIVIPIIVGTAIWMASTPSGKKAAKSIAQKIQELCRPEEKDACEQQIEDDESDCFRNYGNVFGYSSFAFQGCMQNARTRYEQCKKGQPQIPKWNDGHVTGQPQISPRKN
jgi:hypothetical protein